MNPWLISIPLAYLLGSIPFGYLLVKIFRKQDIRATGSGNIGATNVARSGAKGLGIATLLLDCGKAFLAVKIAQQLGPGNYDLAVVAAIAAILRHLRRHLSHHPLRLARLHHRLGLLPVLRSILRALPYSYRHRRFPLHSPP